MSGFEIVGLLLGLYPIVIQAVDVYKATKNGRAAASLFRKLKTEEVIYRQFVQKLLAPNVQDDVPYQLYLNQVSSNLDRWKSVALNQKLRLRLGSDTADLILQILQEIDLLLKDLNTELQSIGRGMVRRRRVCGNLCSDLIVCYDADMNIGSARKFSNES
jgi:hypothetical protein